MRRGTFVFWSIFVAAAIWRIAVSFGLAPPASSCIGQTVHGTAMVANDPERKESGQIFIASAYKLFVTPTSTNSEMAIAPCATNIQVRLKTKLYPRFSFGQEITVSGKLSRPFNFSSDDGRRFDYQGYLAKDDVFYEMKSAQVSSSTSTEVFGRSYIDRMTIFLFRMKRSFVGNLERVLGEPHSALAAGLVVGDKSALGRDLLDDFRIVGLIHIVVLSGFNITIVGVALRQVLSFLPRVWGIVIGGVGIALFGVLVGGGATVIRSCFMAGVALSADLIRRDYSVERALIFAGLIMLIENPLILLHDPSFQLSFLATIGLILLSSPLEKVMKFIPEKFGFRGIVASSLATQIFVSPFILHMMGQVSLIGVVVNILVLPLIPLTMLAVFLTGALGFIWLPLSQVVGWAAHLLLSYELFIVEKFADVPYAAAHVPPFSFWWVVGFYIIFVAGFLFLKKGKSLIQKTNHE